MPVVQNTQPIITALKLCDNQTKEAIANVNVGILKTTANWLAYEEQSAIPSSIIKKNPTGEFSIQVAGGTLRADASLVSDETGTFQYFYQPGTTYALFADAQNYAATYKQYTGWEISQLSDQCIYLNKQDCISLNGRVINQRLNQPIANASVDIVNLCNGEIYSLTSNESGAFEYCLDCHCDYEIVTRKNAYEDIRKEIAIQPANCSQSQAIEMVIALPTAIKQSNNQIKHPTNPEEELTNSYINQYFTGEENPTYHEGQVIRLHRIYYDFDKSVIRPDAAYELDYLVALMEQHPSMEIELSAHTDSRGKSDYNGWLSQYRANAAKNYLLKNGIDRNRIHKAKGYGESRLFNHCSDGEECTEEEHQVNRRTEVKIVRFDGPLMNLSTNNQK